MDDVLTKTEIFFLKMYKKINDYHCSREGFHTSSAQQPGVSSDCVQDLTNQQQLTYFGV